MIEKWFKDGVRLISGFAKDSYHHPVLIWMFYLFSVRAQWIIASCHGVATKMRRTSKYKE